LAQQTCVLAGSTAILFELALASDISKVTEPIFDRLGITLNTRRKLLAPNMTILAGVAPLLQFLDNDVSIHQVGRG
jgi:hypothetical protein